MSCQVEFGPVLWYRVTKKAVSKVYYASPSGPSRCAIHDSVFLKLFIA